MIFYLLRTEGIVTRTLLCGHIHLDHVYYDLGIAAEVFGLPRMDILVGLDGCDDIVNGLEVWICSHVVVVVVVVVVAAVVVPVYGLEECGDCHSQSSYLCGRLLPVMLADTRSTN